MAKYDPTELYAAFDKIAAENDGSLPPPRQLVEYVSITPFGFNAKQIANWTFYWRKERGTAAAKPTGRPKPESKVKPQPELKEALRTILEEEPEDEEVAERRYKPEPPKAPQSTAPLPGSVIIVAKNCRMASRLVWDCYIGDERILERSAQPVTAAARKMLELGYSPDTIVSFRHETSKECSFRNLRLDWVAGKTVVESDRSGLHIRNWSAPEHWKNA